MYAELGIGGCRFDIREEAWPLEKEHRGSRVRTPRERWGADQDEQFAFDVLIHTFKLLGVREGPNLIFHD